MCIVLIYWSAGPMAANCNLQGAPLAEGPLHPAGILSLSILTTFIYYTLYTILIFTFHRNTLRSPPFGQCWLLCCQAASLQYHATMNVIVPAPSQHLQSRQRTENRKKRRAYNPSSPVTFFDLCAFRIFNVDYKSSKMIKIKIGFWVIGQASGSMYGDWKY